MTYGEMYKKFHGVNIEDIEDYRPDVRMHTKDIRALPEGAGIRIWMKNGDGIIYYPSEILKKQPV